MSQDRYTGPEPILRRPERFLSDRDIFMTNHASAKSDWYSHSQLVTIEPTGDRDVDGLYCGFKVTPVSQDNDIGTFGQSWPWTIGVRCNVRYTPSSVHLIDGRLTNAVDIEKNDAFATQSDKDGHTRHATKSHVTVMSGPRVDSFWANVRTDLLSTDDMNITLDPLSDQNDDLQSYQLHGPLRQPFTAVQRTKGTAPRSIEGREEDDDKTGKTYESYRLLNGDHGMQGAENEWDEVSGRPRSQQAKAAYPKDWNEYTQCIDGRQAQMITLETGGDRANPSSPGVLSWYSRVEAVEGRRSREVCCLPAF